MWGAPTDALRVIREDFLRQFAVIELDEAVARESTGALINSAFITLTYDGSDAIVARVILFS